MANLFDGLRKADSMILKMQIAMLQEVKLSNIRNEITQKAKRGTIKAANYVTNFIAKKQFNEPEVLNLSDRVKTNIESNDSLGDDELISKLKDVLKKRLIDAGQNLHNNMSEDELSVAIINLAAKHYKDSSMDKLTPAQKLDVIRHKFNEELVAKLHKTLAKQEYAQARELEQLLQRYIKSFDDETKAEYIETVGNDNLSGTFARNIFISNEGEGLILKVLDNVEKGRHKVFKSVIGGVFLNVLGINIPFDVKSMKNHGRLYIERYSEWISFIGIDSLMSKNGEVKLVQEMLLEVIWLSQEYYGRCYTPYLDELACWFNDNDERQNMIDKTRKIMNNTKLIKEHENSFIDVKADYIQDFDVLQVHNKEIARLKEKKHDANMRMLVRHNDLVVLEEKFEEMKSKYIKATNDFDRIARVKGVSVEDRKELDKIRADYEYARTNVIRKKEEIDKENKKAVDALSAINKKQIEIKDLKLSVEKQKETIDKYEAETSDIKFELDKDVDEVAQWLNRIWHKTYTRCEFGRNVSVDIAKNLEYDEICDVESVLLEMYNTKDPYSLRSTKPLSFTGKGETITFMTLYGKEIIMYYKAVERDEDELKNINITEITIKSDQIIINDK